MARLVPYTTLSAASAIDGTDCMGDSRVVINTNFQNLETILAQAITTDRISTNNPPLTTRTRTLSVFNSTGQYLGFIPIYQ